MFCPKCSAYLTEREIVKTNVKYAPGNIPIEYEARCPNCRVEMGIVSWGQLTVDPKLAAELAAAPPTQPEAGPDPLIKAPELRSTLRRAGDPSPANEPVKPAAASPGGKTCPHCGKPLPEDY